MHAHLRKLDKLKKRLQRIVDEDNLAFHRELIQRTAVEMGVDIVDFAAALLQMSQPHLLQKTVRDETPQPKAVVSTPTYRYVRYRLDVGTKHQVGKDELLEILVDESGVDRNRIVRLDMRDTYTLVDLPEGMPADIFQLLTEATVGNEHALNIKRVKPNRRRPRDVRTGQSSDAAELN
jgi:hypothetical protein